LKQRQQFGTGQQPVQGVMGKQPAGSDRDAGSGAARPEKARDVGSDEGQVNLNTPGVQTAKPGEHCLLEYNVTDLWYGQRRCFPLGSAAAKQAGPVGSTFFHARIPRYVMLRGFAPKQKRRAPWGSRRVRNLSWLVDAPCIQNGRCTDDIRQNLESVHLDYREVEKCSSKRVKQNSLREPLSSLVP
jgi:hypothetical protein